MIACAAMKFSHGPVHHEVISIIKRARQRLILISPYWDLWRGIIAEIERAATRGVKITVIARGGEDQTKQARALKCISSCLDYEGFIDRLHAKIYLNESEALVTSMNLVESSALNSVEVSIHIEQEYASKEFSQVKRICDELRRTAEADRKRSADDDDVPVRTTRSRRNKTGHCIRCVEEIPYDIETPLCEDCYKSWAKYKNPDYTEKYCHECAEKTKTSKNDPLCEDCA